jgi:hypothetical protein
MSNKNITTVTAIYEAFGRGDIPAILEQLANDVQWESWRDDNFAQKAGVPWMKKRTGREGVVDFFKVIGEFKFNDFQVLSLLAGEKQVVAEIEVDFDYPPTGAHVREQELHLWTFDDHGKVVRFRHYLDTAKHIAATKGKNS